jgi:energy-coupling factor transporter ATP-binding protein EcfA2
VRSVRDRSRSFFPHWVGPPGSVRWCLLRATFAEGIAVIIFEHVTKRYPGGTVAVGDLSLEVPDGKIMILVGPSGCGKTTTLRMVNRLVEPTGGRILLGGRDVAQARPAWEPGTPGGLPAARPPSGPQALLSPQHREAGPAGCPRRPTAAGPHARVRRVAARCPSRTGSPSRLPCSPSPASGRLPGCQLTSRISSSTWQNRLGWPGHMPWSGNLGQQAEAVS